MGSAAICPLAHSFFHGFFLLFFFPFCVLQLLVGVEQGVDFAVCFLGDQAAGFVVGLIVAGRVAVEAIERDVEMQEDHPKLYDLVLAEVKLLLEGIELAGRP